MSDRTTKAESLLIAVVPKKRDLRLFERELWYRVPCDAAITRSRNWPPRWLAPFETVAASNVDAQQIQQYARVTEVTVASREELFPGEPTGTRAGRMYFKLTVGPIQRLAVPLSPKRPRRHAFVETTIGKLVAAAQFNDIFNDSPYEDALWEGLKANNIDAERQWGVRNGRNLFALDFALFCNQGKLDVEVDGRHHHAVEVVSISDAERDRSVAEKGWYVARFRTQEVARNLNSCLARISSHVSSYGGMKGANVVRRSDSGEVSTQFALLDDKFQYDADEVEAE